MKVYTTNYNNTFIAVAEDCPAVSGQVPQPLQKPSLLQNRTYLLM